MKKMSSFQMIFDTFNREHVHVYYTFPEICNWGNWNQILITTTLSLYCVGSIVGNI